MVKRLRLLLVALSTVVIVISLWTTQANVMAQSPTKTPIGAPPTKTPLPIEPPTKAPLPTDLPTQTAAPTQAPSLTPIATATATRTPTPRPSATASPTPITRSPMPTAIAGTGSVSATTAPVSITPTATPNAGEAIIVATATPNTSALAATVGNSDPPADPASPILTQTMNIGGFMLGLVILGLVIWFGLARLGRAITNEIHTVSLANLRLQHEAERIDRREKVTFRADSDVLTLLEQAILDASGECVHVRLLPNGWLSSPSLLAVVDAEQTRYLFSPAAPDQVQDSARRHGLTQLLLGRSTDLTAYPIDALNSTPFIVDDLSAAFNYVLVRYQAPRRPLPRTDRWYLYIARPHTSRLPSWFERRVRQTGVLRRLVDRIPTTTHSDSSRKTGE
jgi:hypothetical protein